MLEGLLRRAGKNLPADFLQGISRLHRFTEPLGQIIRIRIEPCAKSGVSVE
jgi:hypothetical protein